MEGTLVASVDPAALEAALINVALNSRDAMPDGGTLTIRTSQVEVAEPPATEDDLVPGRYAVLSLEDTGAGMTPDVVARVFEPFFTTKSGSQGTGLGLSMVYGFAKQSGGAVTIGSQPGHGTTVNLYLPFSGNPPRASKESAPVVEGLTTSRTILVIEDEAAVRNTVRRQLEHLGHRVIVTASAAEAREVLRERSDIDVLLTDVVLGTGMNGIDIAEEARAERPGLGVIFMSGYAAVSEAQERMRETAAPFLPKPASMAQLQRAVNAVCANDLRTPGERT
jgi:CheY-like chemotaxis protein